MEPLKKWQELTQKEKDNFTLNKFWIHYHRYTNYTAEINDIIQ